MPVPTYFTLGRNALPTVVEERIAGGNPEVAPNLVFLGENLPLAKTLQLTFYRQVERLHHRAGLEDRRRRWRLRCCSLRSRREQGELRKAWRCS